MKEGTPGLMDRFIHRDTEPTVPPTCPPLLCHSQDKVGQARQCPGSPNHLSLLTPPARGSARLGNPKWAHMGTDTHIHTEL